MRIRALVLAAALILAPLGAQAADLVVWWEKGYNAEEDEAVREIIAAFEQKTGNQVELVFHPNEELPDELVAALEAGQPPDFAFGYPSADYYLRVGLRRSARGPHGRRSATSQTCSIRMRSPGHLCSTQTTGPARPVRAADRVARSTMSTSGRAFWSRPGSRSRTFPRVGGVLGVLVRPGPAGGAPGDGPRRHLGHRPPMSIEAHDTTDQFEQFLRPTRPTT